MNGFLPLLRGELLLSTRVVAVSPKKRTITLSDRPFVVVGVMPARFRLPLGKGDLWIPMVPPAAGAKAAPGGVSVILRLKPGVAIAQAEAELSAKMTVTDMRGVPGRWQAHLMLPGELA